MRSKYIIPHPLTDSELKRFWSKVDRSGGPDSCWPWIGFRDYGYGKFCLRGKQYIASRVAYLITHGELSPFLLVCHNCPNGDNRACCNPSHLWVGTNRENIQDSYTKGRVGPRGEKHGKSILTEDDVMEIWRMCKYDGVRQVDAARKFGVSRSYVYSIMSRRTWGWINLS